MTLQSSDNGEHQLPARRSDFSSAGASYTTPPGLTSPLELNGFSPAFFLWVFRQWWKFVLPAGLVLASVAAVIILKLYVPKYEASALISIEATTPYIAFQPRNPGGNAGKTGNRYLNTQIELLRSDLVLGPVLSRQDIASLKEFSREQDRLRYMKKHLKVKPVGNSELYKIAYESPSPQDAAIVANAVVAEYLDVQTNEESVRTQRVIEILEEERLGRSVEIERLRQQLTELAKHVTGRDPFQNTMIIEADTALNPVATLYQSMNLVDVEREVLKAEIQALRETPALISDYEGNSGLLDLDIDNQPEVRERQFTIDQIVAAMENIRTQGVRIDWQKDPTYRQLEHELQARQSELDALKVTLRDELVPRQKEERELRNREAIAKLESALAKLDVRARLLSDRYDEHIQDAKTGGAKSVEFKFARDELAQKENILNMIENRKLAMQTETRAPARVRLRQKAQVPIIPLEPVPYKLLLLACSASLVMPFGLAIVREATVRRVSNVEQLHRESKTQVLGEVAHFPLRRVAASSGALPRRVRQEMTIFAESIDALRTNLVLSHHREVIQVLAVCSASAGESKTTVATSLTASIAGATKKPTLIIDADLRSPDVANVLKTEEHPGLGDVLAGECQLSEAIHRIGSGDTYVIPAGQVKKNPHHLIQMQEVVQLLDSLRQQFSNIVIDTGPVLGASESLVFAKAADAVLFCALNGTSRARQVNVTIDRLRNAGCKIAGSVLSGTPPNRYAYVYGYYPERTIRDAS